MEIGFSLNGERVRADAPPTRTLLDWLREERGMAGTKEACCEGDCGACTVIVTDERGALALNACILFMPQLHGKAVRTVEGIAGPDGTLHPVQRALVDHHGSQCGFCTPGFVVAMACSHLNGERDHDTALAGNLCRCTGYAPIVRAAEAAAGEPVPGWMRDAVPNVAEPRQGETRELGGEGPPAAPGQGAPGWALREVGDPTTAAGPAQDVPRPPRGSDGETVGGAAGAAPAAGTARVPGLPPRQAAEAEVEAALPRSADELAAWYEAHPDATLVGGATDVGLWVTKGLRELPKVAFLHRARDLAAIEEANGRLRIGAGATMTEVLAMVADRFPSWATLIRRYGSAQVRNAATIGGSIANGSPIGDNAPVLIALGGTLHLRRGAERRDVAVEDFFVAYGKQDRRPGEFVEAVTIPAEAPFLRAYKLSKRFDQDISAVCGAFKVEVEEGSVAAARIAFGGMAATPKRAVAVERALTGRPWTAATAEEALPAFAQDFQPISDMRASAAYRLEAARGMMRRYFAEFSGQATDLRAVTA